MKAILGTMTFSDQVNHDEATGMVKAFKASGFTELDSAYVYCAGATEKLLGDLNRQNQLAGCEIATKVNPKEGGLTPESVDHQLSTSLQSLSAESVDLVYLHQPDPDTPVTLTLEALDKHYQAGRFKKFGLSNYAAWQVAEIVSICEQRGYVKPTVYQGMYNALTRDVERELFPCLENFNIAFYVITRWREACLPASTAMYLIRLQKAGFQAMRNIKSAIGKAITLQRLTSSSSAVRVRVLIRLHRRFAGWFTIPA